MLGVPVFWNSSTMMSPLGFVLTPWSEKKALGKTFEEICVHCFPNSFHIWETSGCSKHLYIWDMILWPSNKTVCKIILNNGNHGVRKLWMMQPIATGYASIQVLFVIILRNWIIKIIICILVHFRAHCIKITINGNFHGILDADWLWCLVAMGVITDSKITYRF